MFWHLRQLFLNLFIIYEKHILNYSGGVFKGVFKGVHFQNEKCDCIKYLKLVDPACGSGGFILTAMNYIFDNIDNSNRTANAKEVLKRNVVHQLFGVDISPKLVKIAKANMLLGKDGHGGI